MTARQLADALNDCLALDGAAVSILVNLRVACGASLATSVDGDGHRWLDLLGLINRALYVSGSPEAVAAIHGDGPGAIARFETVEV